MPAILNWLLRLLPTNPICMRLVQGGSSRLRHLYIRAGYLAVMIVVLLFVLLGAVSSGSSVSLRELAGSGAQMFQIVSYLQVGLICLLTPVFMAGAIAQEANPRTWEIMLTTPLNNLQVVLGNLFGRLFFVIALLFSSLPLFVMTQYFGGVPGDSIFASYAIAGASALIVAAIAITLSVTRTAGRRAVFIFYASVVMYICVTFAADLYLRRPVGPATTAVHTTLLTPLNPFLALKVLLDSNQYVPHDFTGESAIWPLRMWLGKPIATFSWLCVGASLFLILFSTIRLRVIGASVGTTPWYRKLFGLGAKGATERPAGTVSRNPIAWRESVARGKTMAAITGRWGFVAAGLLIGIGLLIAYHVETLDHVSARLAFASIVGAEVIIIVLAALNMSATAVSREREDGTLDIILTTPIQPGPYIAGKHRGLYQFLLPMMLVPVLTALLFCIYVLFDGFGRESGVELIAVALRGKTTTLDVPIILPEAAIVLPLVLAGFVAFCVMVGLHWSIRSKGTIGSVIGAVAIVLVVAGFFGLCLMPTGGEFGLFGAWFNALSPLNALFAIVYPEQAIPDAIASNMGQARTALVIGGISAAIGYAAAAYALHSNMKRTFMMTVRRLAGAS